MSQSKVLLTFKNDEGKFQIESVWATKEGEYFRIDNIPIFAPNLAWLDLVSVEEDNGALYFDELIEASGHSTLQMAIFNESEVAKVAADLVELGCSWEGSHIKTLISVDVPPDAPYRDKIKPYLDKGELEHRLTYKEACLAHSY